MFEHLLSVFGFALATTITPGPNNLMVLASGANFGYRRTLPHMLGIALGFSAMVLAVALGLGAVLDRFPEAHQALKIVAFLYLLWLAWKMVRADPHASADAAAEPLSFLGAALFQWVNPKAWAIALGAVPLFTTVGGNHLAEMGVVAAMFAVVTVPSTSVWCLFGTAISELLATGSRRRWFNLAMAVLMVGSVVPLLGVTARSGWPA